MRTTTVLEPQASSLACRTHVSSPKAHHGLNRCGWGSGALYYAEVLPKSKVTAFSNSRLQREYIDAQAKAKGLDNLTVITGNVVDYEFEAGSFDRIISIEVTSLP